MLRSPVVAPTHVPEVLKELEELRIDARLGKDKHFFAADRAKGWNRWLGLPMILINVLIGSVFFTEGVSDGIRDLGPLLAFSAAALGAVHTFFNFGKANDAHRTIGNRYIEVSRTCRSMIRQYRDEVKDVDELWSDYEKLFATYSNLNKEAEAFPVGQHDFRRALEKAEARRACKGELLNTDPPLVKA